MLKFIYTFFVLIVCCSAAQAQYVSISAFRARTVNDTIVKGEKIAGRVSVGGEFRNTSFIQDGTGGIAVFNSPFRNAVKIGDSVEISGGQLQDFQAVTGQPKSGLAEIAGSGFVFTVIPLAGSAPQPKITAIQSIGEAVEGMLIKIRSVNFTTSGSFQGDKNYFVKNSNGDSVQVRIDANTEIAINTLPIPTTAIDLIGAVSQFRGTYQIQPRFASDIGSSFEKDTVAKSSTFDVTCWNVKQFMSTIDTSIKDKQRQLESVKRVLDSLDADLVSLEEIASPAGFARLVDTLKTPSLGLLATEISQDQKMAFIYKKDMITSVSSGLAVNGGAQAWANGRYPLRFTFDVTLNGVKKRMTAFSLHAKATGSGTETADLARRTTDASTFYDYLNSFYANDAVIVLGDFNDDVIKSVVGTSNPSPYKMFVDDAARWNVVTKELSERGLSSYTGFSGAMIDHIIVSNEVSSAVYRTKVETPQAYLSSYTTTVSDHVPVSTRLYLNQVVTDVAEEVPIDGAVLRVSPNPVAASGMIEIVNERTQVLQLELFDALGKRVHQLLNTTVSPEIKVLHFDVTTLQSGVYVLRLQSTSGIQTRQVVVIK